MFWFGESWFWLRLMVTVSHKTKKTQKTKWEASPGHSVPYLWLFLVVVLFVVFVFLFGSCLSLCASCFLFFWICFWFFWFEGCCFCLRLLVTVSLKTKNEQNARLAPQVAVIVSQMFAFFGLRIFVFCGFGLFCVCFLGCFGFLRELFPGHSGLVSQNVGSGLFVCVCVYCCSLLYVAVGLGGVPYTYVYT